MHEISICEGIRGAIETAIAGENVHAIKTVRLEIGQFAGIEKPALEFAFGVVMRGTLAEGARLDIVDVPGKAMCYDCGAPKELSHRLAPCPDCGGGRLMPVSGDELKIKDLEVI